MAAAIACPSFPEVSARIWPFLIVCVAATGRTLVVTDPPSGFRRRSSKNHCEVGRTPMSQPLNRRSGWCGSCAHTREAKMISPCTATIRDVPYGKEAQTPIGLRLLGAASTRIPGHITRIPGIKRPRSMFQERGNQCFPLRWGCRPNMRRIPNRQRRAHHLR